jgi:ketosteroid isomerase-like protein
MAEHENASRLRRGYDAFASGDLEKLNEFIPEDAVWHVTGNNAFSGDYKGRAEVYAYFGKLIQGTGGTFKATLVHVVADDNFSVAIQRSTATINGVAISSNDVLVDRVEDGQAVETWIYFENEKLLDGVTI